jgi:hypothetical protein
MTTPNTPDKMMAALDRLDDAAHALNSREHAADRLRLMNDTDTLRTGIAELTAECEFRKNKLSRMLDRAKAAEHRAEAAEARVAECAKLADKLEAFQPKGEIGPLHGAGMAFAYKDAANAIRAAIDALAGQPDSQT